MAKNASRIQTAIPISTISLPLKPVTTAVLLKPVTVQNVQNQVINQEPIVLSSEDEEKQPQPQIQSKNPTTSDKTLIIPQKLTKPTLSFQQNYCLICKRNFTELAKHVFENHVLTVRPCNLKTTTILQTSDFNPTYFCLYCHQYPYFKTKEQLFNHIKTCVQNMTDSGWCLKHCGFCRFGFKTMEGLKRHLEKCKYFKCFVCQAMGEKNYIKKSDFELENHWRRHHADFVGGLVLDLPSQDKNGVGDANAENNIINSITNKYS